MEIKLTTLCENTVSGPGFTAEWGWSIHIQSDGLNILFDTGANIATVKNADKLGIDLKALDMIILSHSHQDHTGGLREVLKRTGHLEILAHPALWIPKYKKRKPDKPAEFNGIPYRMEEIEKHAALKLSQEPVQLSDAIMTTGEVALTTDFEKLDPDFYVKENGTLRPDDFPDDLALIIRAPQGLVIVLGCAHRGVINTIQHARKITGEESVHAVIGGTHLFPKKKPQVQKTIDALKEIDVRNIGVSHCTGMDAAMQFAHAFGDKFFFNNAGTVRTIE